MGDDTNTAAQPGKRPAGRPPRHVAQEISDRLLDSARTLFCQKGISGTSMEDVAEQAGIAKQTIYRRYPGKAALIDEVVGRDLDRLLASDAPPGLPPLERLRATAWNRFQFMLNPENQDFISFIIAESVFSPPLREQFRQCETRVLSPIIAQIEDAQKAGNLRKRAAKPVANLLEDLVGGAAERMRWAVADALDGQEPEEWFEERWQAFVKLEAA